MRNVSFGAYGFYDVFMGAIIETYKLNIEVETYQIEADPMDSKFQHSYDYLVADEIIQLRHRYCVAPSIMSKIMGFAENKWKAYEEGEVPSESEAKDIMAIQDESVFRDFLERAKDVIGDRVYVRIKYRLYGNVVS